MFYWESWSTSEDEGGQFMPGYLLLRLIILDQGIIQWIHWNDISFGDFYALFVC